MPESSKALLDRLSVVQDYENAVSYTHLKISPTSKQYVNPMDLNLDYSDDDNPLSLKVDFILSLIHI